MRETKRRVLLVGNHAATRQALKLVLERTEGMAVAVSTVAEGVRLASDGEPFDLVVLIPMPSDAEVAGVVRALKESRPATPLAVLGAGQDPCSVLEAGADETLGARGPLANVVASIVRLAG